MTATPWLDEAGNWTLDGSLLFVRAVNLKALGERQLLMRILECRGPKATAVGAWREMPYLADTNGAPMRPEDVIPGITGLPCNAQIVEPELVFRTTFDGHHATLNAAGELVVDCSRPDVEVDVRREER